MLPKEHFDKETADIFKSATDSLNTIHLPLQKDGHSKATDKINEINDDGNYENDDDLDDVNYDTYDDEDDIVSVKTPKPPTIPS